MRTQYQIAAGLHAETCPDACLGDCSLFEEILAALREQSLLTRAACAQELEERAKRWRITRPESLNCAAAIRNGLASMFAALALLAWVQAPVSADERSVNPGVNIIDQGGTRRVIGDAYSPVTIRNWFFDLNLEANDWPHGPQLLDAAAISSINRLDGTTTPASFYGFELVGSRSRRSYSLPSVRGTRAIRGQEITLWDEHMPWESPHDADRWTGLGIYAESGPEGIGRRLGTGLVIGGSVGWQTPLLIVDEHGRAIFEVRGDGTVLVRGRPLNP